MIKLIPFHTVFYCCYLCSYCSSIYCYILSSFCLASKLSSSMLKLNSFCANCDIFLVLPSIRSLSSLVFAYSWMDEKKYTSRNACIGYRSCYVQVNRGVSLLCDSSGGRLLGCWKSLTQIGTPQFDFLTWHSLLLCRYLLSSEVVWKDASSLTFGARVWAGDRFETSCRGCLTSLVALR